MAQFAGPYTTGNMDQPQWEKVEAGLWTDGVMSGIDNAMLPTLTSGLGVSVATGRAIVDGFRFYNDAAQALTATAADPTNPRIDRIVVRIDGTGHTGTLAIKAGTPAPSPTPPALTQTIPAGTYEISLAQIRINAGATTIASLTDERTFTKPNIAPNGVSSAQIASVAPATIQAGALPAGVTVPAAQVTSGLLGTGVQLPGGANLPGGQLGVATGADLVDGSTTSTTFKSRTGGSRVNFNIGATNVLSIATDSSLVFGSPGNFFYGVSSFSGGGTGTFSHGFGATPSWIGVTPSVNGSATTGVDTIGATTAHMTIGAALGFIAIATKSA